MNISFQNRDTVKNVSLAHREEHVETGKKPRTGGKEMHCYIQESVKTDFENGGVYFLNGLEEIWGNKENAKSFAEVQQEASVGNVDVSQDYMILMSHTLSDEDYRKLSDEGFHFSYMNEEEAVTIVDKIKAELVRSGQHIAGYTDDLDLDTLAAAVGSESLARAVFDSFAEADIPMTKENLVAVERAWTMASELVQPTEGSYQYMIANEMEPEIVNFYLAQNSGADAGMYDGASYDVDENLQKQIEQVLEKAGYEVNEENYKSAKWLLGRRLPLTEENLKRLDKLKEAVIPVTEESFIYAVTDAFAEGKDASCGKLTEDAGSGGIYEKAVEVMERWFADSTEIFYQGDIGARKQLEEIRLRMTAEVNVKLLKSGFAIDTAPMEALIEALKQAEAEVADSFFKGDADAVSKYRSWNLTNQVMEDLPALPVQLLGTVKIHTAEEKDTTLVQFHEEGIALRRDYIKAGERYEALMTGPRADLGDSMQKAFRNVDILAENLGLEPTEENKRILRILGYNQMEISRENYEKVKEAADQVSSVIAKMTPAATLKMIRDGVNPLERSFEELNAYFDSLPQEYLEEAEKYSRYLYGLEKNQEITKQEAEAYIGVYRLLHQIEKKEGAAIGAVVNSQADLQFANLLSAVRSGKFKHMDVRATDELGILKELVRKGEDFSVSEQIMQGYEREQLKRLREVTQADASVTALLQRGELPITGEHLLAAKGLLQDGDNPFKTLRKKAELLRESERVSESVSAENMWEELDTSESFESNYMHMVEELQVRAETYTFAVAEDSLDIRLMQTTYLQLGIMGSAAKGEEYFLPMEIGGESAMVHLTFEGGAQQRGRISVSVEAGENIHMKAFFCVQNGYIDGYLVGKSSYEVRKLQETSDIFCSLVNQNASLGLEAVSLPVVNSESTNWTGMSYNNSQGETTAPDNGTLYRVAKIFLQAIK